ncbi:MAG: hypothetical protein ABJP70_05685 [Erythrobacter sp.]
MIITQAQWNRCIGLIKSNAPAFPNIGVTRAQRDRSNSGRSIGLLDTFLGELDLGLSSAAGNLVTVATANSVGDVVDSFVDSAAGEAVTAFAGEAAGGAVGGVIALFRGAMQEIERSDEMANYLSGTTAYVLSISRVAVDTMYANLPYIRMPQPAIPHYADLTGQYRALPSMRRHFMSGYEAARRMFDNIDSVRPTSGAHYSKQFCQEMMLNAGYGGGRRGDIWRVRQNLELLILRDVLGADLRARRQQLMRWARSA